MTRKFSAHEHETLISLMKKIVMAKKQKGQLIVRTKARVNRQVVSDDEETHEASVVGEETKHTAQVRSGLMVTLSQNFCSVSVTAGIEMPVYIEHPNDDVTARRQLKNLDLVVEKHLHKRMKVAQRLLDKLAERNR